MKKENLVEFINRFYLQGNLTKDSSGDWFPVKFKTNGKVTQVLIKTSDKSVLIDVDANLDLPDGEFIIGNVKQLLSVLGAFGNEIELSLKQDRQSFNNIMFLKDPNLEATIALADPSTIEDETGLKSTPDCELDFELKKEFIERFIRAKKAMNDALYFAIFPDDMNGSVDFIINYSQDTNTNNIKVTNKEINLSQEFEPLLFNCNNFTAILQENSDFRSAKISVSGKGLMIANFKGEDWESNYYLKAFQL